METPNDINRYFINALKWYVDTNGHGTAKEIAGKIGVSGSFISKIVKDSSDKKTPEKRQPQIAEACGYTYTDFLEIGRKISNGEQVNPDEKNSGTAQVQTKSGGADMSSGGADVDHYRSELSAQRKNVDYLRKEVDYLRGERDYLRVERDEIRMERDKLREALKALKAQAEQPKPAKEEKKTAV